MESYLVQSNVMKIPIADKSVQCCVTSPPYYGLRDYGIGGQLGLEPTLEEYIENTVLWAREVWRVLKDDGVFWLNIGDSFAGSGKGGNQERFRHDHSKSIKPGETYGLKPKDLMLVPHRVAIALQNDGWWVRSDIVWAKPNPMPESVRDRPTKAHEYIFLLSKSKKYFYDADAVREPHADTKYTRERYKYNASKAKKHSNNKDTNVENDTFAQYFLKQDGCRNKRSVWTITTKPYPGSHFATFPPELPETCIKAGTSEKGECPECGKAWVRVTEKETSFEGGSGKAGRSPEDIGGKWGDDRYGKNILLGPVNTITTVGWKPQCEHGHEPVPQVVLDPFAGSGTTVMVANALGRKGVGLDLSWDYLQLAKERTGMKALEEWKNGKKVESNLAGLPMFEANP